MVVNQKTYYCVETINTKFYDYSLQLGEGTSVGTANTGALTLLNIPQNNGTQLSERDSGSNREQLSGETTSQIADIDEESAHHVPSSSVQPSLHQHDIGLRANSQFGLQNHHHHSHHQNRWHHQAQTVAFPPLPPSSSNKISSQARGSGTLSSIHTPQVIGVVCI